MKKLLYLFFSICFPVLAFADGTSTGGAGALSFAPPPGDYSMVFLGNIFGLVDGVLSGTGSQIMGDMFGVFNAAVLALGGIIIMYTLMVSTMNTAHEGQFLGQKWSSVWIPVRSSIGLALLIPKASGYCLMQIFVMWVVVQGVGAADKVWETALSYLNAGGVIIRAEQPNPVDDLLNEGNGNPTFQGAYSMLAGQVCMLGLQTQLTALRKEYLDLPKEISPCKTNSAVKTFCDKAVPDFAASVDFLQAETGTTSPYTVAMPNFSATSGYQGLNGLCGTIQWKKYTGLDATQCKPGDTSANSSCGLLSESEATTLGRSRAAALMTMYNRLLPIAQIIVNNNPLISQSSPGSNSNQKSFTPTALRELKKNPYSPIAASGFGMPYTLQGVKCQKYDDNCVNWGPAGGSNSTYILSGTQFLGAIQSYNAVMAPTLNLAKQMEDMNTTKKDRAFISTANSQGWIMAGTYFFDLVKLNGSAKSNGATDRDNGLEQSLPFNRTPFFASFKGENQCADEKKELCEWLGRDKAKLLPVAGMIDGTGYTEKLGSPKFKVENAVVAADTNSATVNGFVQNSIMVRLPGQPGLATPTFVQLPSFKIKPTDVEPLPGPETFDCGYVFLLGCFGRAMGDFFYNSLLRPIHAFFLKVFGGLIQSVVNAFIMIPLTAMSTIFIQGMKIVSEPGVNPVIALSKMGEHYINAAGNMWINMLTLSISTSLIPFIGKFIFALITMAMPLIIAWLSIMVGVGFITCYYIPMLPYLIFTFASLGWLIAVIEAMVAAPLVALGVTHPEGHDAFGKGEHAVMIIMNVFLRPAMMIIGYIAAISLCYVGVWILNAGFGHAIEYIVGVDIGGDKLDPTKHAGFHDWGESLKKEHAEIAERCAGGGFKLTEECKKVYAEKASGEYGNAQSRIQGNAYVSWAGIYAFFFAILSYTSAYLTIVQKAFTLIHLLPDKVLRWIGGQPEGIGGETAGWAEESKKSVESAGEKTSGAQGKISEKLGAAGDKAVSGLKDMTGNATDPGKSEVK